MARDYAKKTPPRPHKKPIPGWLWLSTGLAIGLFAAFLVYLSGNKAPDRRAPTPPVARAEKPAPPPRPAPAGRADERSKPKYDFYTILPKYEVAVPEEEQPTTAGKKTPPPQAALDNPGDYFLQVGSFRHESDADSLKAQLALLGIVSTLETVTVNGDETWHRVKVGPFPNRQRFDKVRELLHQNDIRYLVVKKKG
jgi:cell division protein FtsN